MFAIGRRGAKIQNFIPCRMPEAKAAGKKRQILTAAPLTAGSEVPYFRSPQSGQPRDAS